MRATVNLILTETLEQNIFFKNVSFFLICYKKFHKLLFKFAISLLSLNHIVREDFEIY